MYMYISIYIISYVYACIIYTYITIYMNIHIKYDNE